MIPIGGMPILWHIMKSYASHDFNRFVLCLGYKAHVVKNFFLNYDAYRADFTIKLGEPRNGIAVEASPEAGWEVTLADTGLHAMTGARVRRVRQYLQDDEHFFLTYGDGVGTIDLKALLDFHKSHGRIATVTGVRPPGRFGELQHTSGQVRGFNEKPQASGGLISAGFFVFKREFLDRLGDDEGLVLEKEPMNELVRDEQLMVYEHEGFWSPMDTYRDFNYLNGLYGRGEAPWVTW